MIVTASVFAVETAHSPLESLVFEPLRGLDLTADQTARIFELVQQYSLKITDLERRATPTPRQEQRREVALQQALERDLRGVDAYSLIAAASELTADQIRAGQALMQEYRLLNADVLGVLTAEQRSRLEGQASMNHENDDQADDKEIESRTWSGFVIIPLAVKRQTASKKALSLADAARELNLEALAKLLTEFQVTKSERAVEFIPGLRAADPANQPEMDQLLSQLEQTWRVDARHLEGKAVTTLVNRLNELLEVEGAYRERAALEPLSYLESGSLANNPYAPRQEYLNPAPRGIDARYAWTIPHGKGATVGLVDLERGWNFQHEDFAAKPPVLLYGSNLISASNHGTAALGEVIADDNRSGVIGAAPARDYVFVTSWHRPHSPSPNIASALLRALSLMNRGDVLQVEVQRAPGIPVEDDDTDYRAIRTAVLAGMIVIEAAGNRGRNLDLHRNPAGKHIFERGGADFRDSGAILVGASNPADSHNRGPSCFGSRVDCFAWGNSVVSCGGGDLDDGGGDPNKQYTRRFSGTSSAVPIIAGAAMLLQGLSKGNAGIVLSPHEMRSLVSDPLTGTPQGSTVTGAIGVMPDLRAIIAANPALQASCLPMPCPNPSTFTTFTSCPTQPKRACHKKFVRLPAR